MDFPGHNDDLREGASGFVVNKGNTYAQPGILFAFPISVSIEPPDTRGQGRLRA